MACVKAPQSSIPSRRNDFSPLPSADSTIRAQENRHGKQQAAFSPTGSTFCLGAVALTTVAVAAAAAVAVFQHSSTYPGLPPNQAPNRSAWNGTAPIGWLVSLGTVCVSLSGSAARSAGYLFSHTGGHGCRMFFSPLPRPAISEWAECTTRQRSVTRNVLDGQLRRWRLGTWPVWRMHHQVVSALRWIPPRSIPCMSRRRLQFAHPLSRSARKQRFCSTLYHLRPRLSGRLCRARRTRTRPGQAWGLGGPFCAEGASRWPEI